MITSLIRILSGRSVRPYVFRGNRDVDYTQMRTIPGLYVHVPFCTVKCPFCPYNKMEYGKSICEDYTDALISEIHLVGKKTGKRKISTVYFGGGSPILLGDRLPKVIGTISENFNITGEMAIEVNVADLDERLIRTLLDFGFNMISIGVQSFSEEPSRNLGRTYVADAGDRVSIASDAGFDAVDVDLIFGIPGQTTNDLARDFGVAAECGATQISTYPFIDFSYTDNVTPPLANHRKREMLSALVKISKDCGFDRSSVWSFVRPGTKRYSSITREAFIGFGASAASLLSNTFAVNTFSISEYIRAVNSGIIPTALSLHIDERTAAGYWLFWRLYSLDISRDRFSRLFGVSIESVFGWELRLVLAAGLLIENRGGYRLSERGAYYYHLLEQKYTNKYIDTIWRALRQTAWPGEVTVY